MSFKQEFLAYISDCFEKRRTVQLLEVIEKEYILQETEGVTRLDDLKRMWKGRFKKSYEIFQEDSQSAYTPNIDLDVNEDMWASLYAKVVQRQDKRNQNIACSDRLATTSALYKHSNAQYRDNLLATSSSHSPKRQKLSDDIDGLIPRAPVAAMNVSGKDFRNLVFKAGYNLLKNQSTMSTAQELNIMASNLNPTSFGEHMDHLAHYLLGKKQTKETEFALKLALSRIVYMVGGTVFHVQRQYFKERHLEALVEEAGNSKPSLESGLDANMIGVYTDFLRKVDDSSTEARLFLMQKRIEVLSGGGEDTDLMKMLDILDYMVADALSLPDSKASELTWYRKTAHILDILFRKSGVSLNDGELCCNATKVARNENKLLCDDSDDKKPVLGRRIDLLLNAASMDISSSEWKKDGVSASLVEQQQIKNVRTNSAILRQLHKLPVDEERKPNVYVLAMDWIGVCGYIFAVKEINEVHVAHHIGDLVLPASLSSFQDFQTTLDLLFSFRNHQLKLKRIVEPAYNRQSASNTLKSFRSVTPPPTNEASNYPGTFFSPVKKQPKAGQSNIIHPPSSDDIDDTYDNL